MQITNNKREFQFEALLEDGEKATMVYRWLKGSMVLMHTLVPASAKGQGVGSELAKYVLEYAKTNNLKIIVYCPFVAKYLEKHPEYNELLDESQKR